MTTCKKLIGQTPFNLVHGWEGLMPMEFIELILCISTLANIIDRGVVEHRLFELLQLEEDCAMARFHHNVQKVSE